MKFSNLRLATKLWMVAGLMVAGLFLFIGFAAGRTFVDRADNPEFLAIRINVHEPLERMVSKIRAGTDNISAASAEIANGNNDLAQRTEQTSSHLRSTASTMDGITLAVGQSAENARQARPLASNASSVVRRGGSVTTMGEIDASSKQISEIIGVIDDIVCQTNILAPNATVEAERAGEQGRGFAVVASEVRYLAGRSAEVAREIKAQIGVSVKKVVSGTWLVTDAGSTMVEIVDCAQRVAEVISDITDAAEQGAGIAGVNEPISNLDQITQQNAAPVEQSATAADYFRDEAGPMKQVVSVFKLSFSH